MSKYTTEIRFICETLAPNATTISDRITQAAPKIFDFAFPIFEESHRLPLESKILRHYYTREIGEETIALWKFRLEDKLNLIMPFYNELYKTANLEFELLNDVDYTRTGNNNGTDGGTVKHTVQGQETRTDDLTQENTNTRIDNLTQENNDTRTDNLTQNHSTNQTDKGTVNNNGTDWNYHLDTPQGGVSQMELTNNTYLTTADKTTRQNEETRDLTTNNTGNVTNTGTVQNTGNVTNKGTVENTGSTKNTGTVSNERNETNTEERDLNNSRSFDEHTTGRMSHTPMELVKQYRENILNIDNMIIDELGTLFINVW